MMKLRTKKGFTRVTIDVLPVDLKNQLVREFGIHSDEIDVLQSDSNKEEFYIGIPYSYTYYKKVWTTMAEIHIADNKLISIEGGYHSRKKTSSITVRELLEGYASYKNLY